MEEKNNNHQELKNIDKAFTHDFKPKDIYLTTAAYIAENGFEVNVTLFLNGIIVSGVLISNKRYSSLLAGKIYKASNQEAGQAFLDVMLDIRDCINERDKEINEIEYLYLSDVEITNSNGNKLKTDSEMRIKLGEVNGFIFGKLVDC
ncbi:hypothetical protein [Xenorhabdus taiwanensis]|uniref:Gas vesicle protein n=1 Tax=Xenorhabdus taiwanensis TaxID=3085177 RepID=A0ABN7C4N0_9GAMM|nr:hypothetical protein TCT1_22040 [Xenorhabdus sp. TCT-1]BET97811.1 hypothetical protein TCT1_27320 [Xenorhabdus sp. TCT-1]